MDTFSTQMEKMWDQRFGEGIFAYGTAPNAFFARQLSAIPDKGRLLLPAEGQGRNAVHAASQGWQVDAFDLSQVGRARALALAESKDVSIHYWIQDLADLRLPEEAYDVVGLIFMHLPPALRNNVHSILAKSLRPGGQIILQGFSKKQLGLPSGGPKTLDMLFSKEELEEDFEGLSLEIETQRIVLDEGPYHQGVAEVVNLIGKKKIEETFYSE